MNILFRIRDTAAKSRIDAAGSVVLAIAWCALCASAYAQGGGDINAVKDPKAIVDCKLPDQVRKLGGKSIWLKSGQVLRLGVAECEIRGGQYVLFDRADPATALAIWQGAAKEGDAVAQFRVGQIHEMGIGLNPDYAAAANWYRKAADQGYGPAAMNLAVLYEKGLGVKQDAAAAADLYRKAQGLPVSGAEARDWQEKFRKAQERITQLEAEKRQLVAAGAPTSQKQKELDEVRVQKEQILAKNVPLDSVVDVGKNAGSRPSIQLIDPNLVLTRGNADLPIRSSVTNQSVVGRVKTRNELKSFTVNDKDIGLDRFGFFETSVALGPDRTPLRIVAIDRANERDEVSVSLIRGKPPQAPEPPAPPALGNYYALVIGNNLYRSFEPLKTPIDDAKAVANVLTSRYGFKVQLLLNATFEQTLNALNDLVRTLTPNDNLIIYYAGHGAFDLGKRGYWIPVDAEKDRNTRWILNVQITDLLLKMNPRKILVISDSCYSGALTVAENGAIPTILLGIPEETRSEVAKQLASVQSRTMLTSGALQPVWDGGPAGHSIFAKALLDVLGANDSIIEGYRVYESVEARVVRDSQKICEREVKLGRKCPLEADQTPLYAAIQHAGHQGADFIFVPKPRAR